MPEFGRWASVDWFVALLGAFKARWTGSDLTSDPALVPKTPLQEQPCNSRCNWRGGAVAGFWIGANPNVRGGSLRAVRGPLAHLAGLILHARRSRSPLLPALQF